jgi:hypothetical protein
MNRFLHRQSDGWLTLATVSQQINIGNKQTETLKVKNPAGRFAADRISPQNNIY